MQINAFWYANFLAIERLDLWFTSIQRQQKREPVEHGNLLANNSDELVLLIAAMIESCQ